MPQAQPNTAPPPPRDEVHYRLLKLLAEQPQASQRDLSRALRVSLGKINYCIKALLDQGWIKASNLRNSRNKLAYAYLLTPIGIDAKARLTTRFLQRKLAEYEALKAEIARLRAEVVASGDTPRDCRTRVHSMTNPPTTTTPPGRRPWSATSRISSP